MEKIRNKIKDDGCSGAKAFFSFDWRNTTTADSVEYKGFILQYKFTGYRWNKKQDIEKRTLIQGWKQEVDQALAEYKVRNYVEYAEKQKEQAAKENTTKDTNIEEPTKDKNKDGKPSNVDKDSWANLLEEVKNLRENQTKTEPEKVKEMSEIMATVKAKNKEETDKLNKDIERLTEETQNIGQNLQQAIVNNNKTQERFFLAQLKDRETALGNALLAKDEVLNEKDFKEYLALLKKEQEASFWENIRFDWTSPWTYAKFCLLSFIIFVVFALFMWLWGKIKSYFSTSE